MAALPHGDGWKKGDEDDVSEIRKCFCPNCRGGNGVTIMLPTKVPLFREIIVMSFSCEDCSFRNTEINFGGEIQPKGERIELKVTSADDLNRQLIKSDSASLSIPQLDFEIPPGTQRGTISTLEGVLKRAADNLELLQPERLRLGDVENFHRCRDVIQKLRLLAGEPLEQEDDDESKHEQSSPFPFDIILDDPAGNSFIENLFAPSPDPNMKALKYFRTPTQDMSLGLQPSKEAMEDGTIDDANPLHKNVANALPRGHAVVMDKKHDDDSNLAKQEVLKFPTNCPHCTKPAETDMCMTDIPHFKEVIIMSLVCDHCGFRSNEIKGGGAIPRYGTKITLRVTTSDDLQREVLKSDTAGLEIPELDLELEEGGLDGLYTTVEGLLNKVHDRLHSVNPFGSGDAAKKQHLTNDGGAFSEPSPNHARYMAFLAKLKNMADGNIFPFSLIISDPLSNSFVGPVPKDAIALALQMETEGHYDCYDNYVDHGMDLEEFERSHDQNEILGLNDIKTENYQQGDDDDSKVYYGTDNPEELPDRIRRLDVRGPDHPHLVGKAPVEGDFTVMGAGSVNFAVPSMAQRGKRWTGEKLTETVAATGGSDELRELIRKFEHDDDKFRMNDEYNGPVEGMVYKDGAQGLGYYTDMPLHKLWKEHNKGDSVESTATSD